MRKNPLLVLQALGQSIWLDYLGRGAIVSGQLRQLIDNDGLSGITSNPSIFEKAIGQSHDYDAEIHSLARQGQSASEIYEALTVKDIQQAADLFRPLYDRLDGKDGFVSLEVSPGLAHDTEGTIREARKLWAAVNRPNALIKVPATIEGLPAIQQLTSEGISVNITLLFGLPRYRLVAESYLAGLESRLAQGKSLKPIASVASFFLSRIDVPVDSMLETIVQSGGKKAGMAARLRGEAAISSAKVASQIYREIFLSERFRKLASAGARSQRLLWASTSTKNPAYSDVKYVEPLIGPETINTVPLETLNAYRDHGRPKAGLDEGIEKARATLALLPGLGIDLDAVTRQLEDEGVEKFNKSFRLLMAALEKARAEALAESSSRTRRGTQPKKGTQKMKKTKRQTFNYSAHGATNVMLVGDFTNWQKNPISMHKGKGELRTAAVELSPGEHHYRFIVDGEWRDDPECTLRVSNPFGSEDMVAEVAA